MMNKIIIIIIIILLFVLFLPFGTSTFCYL